jgi:hypothetical protein
MKKILFSFVFMLIGLCAFAKTNNLTIKNVKSYEEASLKLITYEVDNPIMGKVSISVPENALNNNVVCGFPVYFNDGGSGSWGGSGSFWFNCDSKASFIDVLNALLELFF